MKVSTTTEFKNAAAIFAGRMLSLNKDTRLAAVDDAAAMMAVLPKDIKNSPHIRDEMGALYTLMARVDRLDATA